MREAREFADVQGLSEHADLFARAALVAQNPGGFDDLEDLDQDQKDAIRYEMTNKWSVPLRLYFTIALCSIGAAVQVRAAL